MTDGNRCKVVIGEALANVSNGSEAATEAAPATGREPPCNEVATSARPVRYALVMSSSQISKGLPILAATDCPACGAEAALKPFFDRAKPLARGELRASVIGL